MSRIPLATYRIQFHPGFGFDDAAAVADYLAELGVSHLYASPYLQAAAGSTHGYDVVDTGKVNEELGGAAGHERLCNALKENRLGQILDVVPNHIAITGQTNIWWQDVLEKGPLSPYAYYFDLDWNPPEKRLRGKIFLPVLGDQYGRVLERGEIRLEAGGGRLRVRYFDNLFPVSSRSQANLLAHAAENSDSPGLAFFADAFKSLTAPVTGDTLNTQRLQRNTIMLEHLLAQMLADAPDTAAILAESIRAFNASPDLLDAFLQEQHYRLAYWRAGSRDLGYRRFFNIDTLIGLRMEDATVFAETHRLILEWLDRGVLDGIRVDHPDGLADPAAYFTRLRKAAENAWIVVEKILEPGEILPPDWPVAGTTGYEFLVALDGLFVDSTAEPLLTEFYGQFSGAPTDYPQVAREKKHQVLQELFGSELNRLTEQVIRICESRPRYRDFTRYDINEALREIIACFPVYRTYADPAARRISETDRRIIAEAIAAAGRHRIDIDPELLSFLKELLLLELSGTGESEFVVRFQQTTGPAAAKGIEDTAFYNYNRFVVLNEVGGDPARFGLSPEAFHEAMLKRAAQHPHAMLSTSTHDTKRSEDVRARLALLSEIPQRWCEAAGRWSERNQRYRGTQGPEKNMEYFLYQNLVGAWPIEKDRILAFFEKAVREAKAQTSWTRIDSAYESQLRHFVESIYADGAFLDDLEAFVHPLIEPGRINSLSMTLIKLTAPGVPDIYQGSELWDLSLVDPDNRRPVDFGLRRRLLAESATLTPEETMAHMDIGLPKLNLMHRTLSLRKERASALRSGSYAPVPAGGAKSRHVIAFSREGEIICVVPRLVVTLDGDWQDTRIELPPGIWHNVLTDESVEGGRIDMQRITARFPVALLVRER